MKFLITNNGAHPPGKWAELTAESILNLITISEEPTDDEAMLKARDDARRTKINLFPVLFNILEQAFDEAQKGERKLIARHSHKRLEHDLNRDIAPRVSEAMGKLQTAFAGSMFADHFAKPDVVDVIQRIIGQHIGNNMHIERSYHADRNPDTKEALAFRARHA